MAGLGRRGARRTSRKGAAIALAAALAAASPAAAEPAAPAAAPAALARPEATERLLAQCAALDAHILGLIEDHAEPGGRDAADPAAIRAAVAGLLEARALLRERRAEQALGRYESIALDRPRRPLR